MFTFVGHLALVLGPLLTLPFCLHRVGLSLWDRSRRGEMRRPQHWVPVSLGAAIVLFALGQIVRQSAFPSWADALWLMAYPFLLVSVLLLPTRSLPSISRNRILVDGLMILTAVAAFSWYFSLGPVVFETHLMALARTTIAAYALWHLILVLCLLLLSTYLRESGLRLVVSVLAVAVGILLFSDSVYAYQTLHGTATSQTLLEFVRSLGYMLVGLAGGFAPAALVRQRDPIEAIPSYSSVPDTAGMPHVWRYLFPYALIPAVVALIIYMGHVPTNPNVERGVYIVAAVLVELAFVHQYLAYRELIAYANRSARLETLAGTDPVTGLPNHRTVVALLDQEIDRSRRHNRSCAVLFLDLDHFKALNDTLGHQAGDIALREFSSVVRTVLRGFDSLGRWGGEEFVALLPETDNEAALGVAERARAAVAAHAFWAAGGARITCSCGVATYPSDAQDRARLIQLADQAMYAAKRLGRNQVRGVADLTHAADVEPWTTGSRQGDSILEETVEALVSLLEARSQGTRDHIHSVSRWAVRLAVALGVDAQQTHLVGLAGRLHDIGKVGLPDDLLQNADHLTEEERARVRSHAVLGAATVSSMPTLRPLAPLIRAHHERWDGKGYPDGLAMQAIPLGARILAVADAYSVMTADRPNRPASRPSAAFAELRRCSGTQFDPHVVDALERVLRAESLLTDSVDVA